MIFRGRDVLAGAHAAHCAPCKACGGAKHRAPPLIHYILILSSLLLISTTPKHDFHISTTEVTLNTKAQKTEWLIRVFQDDLEIALKKEFNTKVDLQKQPETNILLKQFFNNHLIIKKNALKIPLNYLGYELQDQSCWIYIETETLLPPFSIKATWLQDVYADQKNLFRVQFSENKSFFCCDTQNPEVLIPK